MSPYDRERYDPRPRYSDEYGLPSHFLHSFPARLTCCSDAHSRHGYSTSPRRHNQPFPPSRRAPPDPHTFDYPASLKQYADWFRYFYPSQAAEEDTADKAAEQEAGDGSKPRNGIKSKWEKYKKDFAATQVSTFVHYAAFHAMCLLFCVVLRLHLFLYLLVCKIMAKPCRVL